MTCFSLWIRSLKSSRSKILLLTQDVKLAKKIITISANFSAAARLFESLPPRPA
jgi:hypothetical protein